VPRGDLDFVSVLRHFLCAAGLARGRILSLRESQSNLRANRAHRTSDHERAVAVVWSQIVVEL
jgi:hypothetical protein